VKVCGNTGVSDIVLLCVIEKGVLDSHIVAAKDVDKVLAMCVASRYAIWPEDLLMFVTSPCADTSVDVRAYNNLCVQIDIREDRVEHVAKLFVLSVVAGEVHIH
jgi:hypothetical protein